jgi:hypothetical protein
MAASGAILISLALWYGMGAAAADSSQITILLASYALGLLLVGIRLLSGRAGPRTLLLAILLPAIPVILVAVRIFTSTPSSGAPLSPVWILPLAAVVCSIVALLATRRRPTPGLK